MLGVWCKGLDGGQEPVFPLFKGLWTSGLESIVVTKTADRFTERDMDIQVVGRTFTGRSLPQGGKLEFRPRGLRAAQI